MSAALELGDSVIDGSGAFIERTRTAPVLPMSLIRMRRIRTSVAVVEMLISRVNLRLLTATNGGISIAWVMGTRRTCDGADLKCSLLLHTWVQASCREALGAAKSGGKAKRLQHLGQSERKHRISAQVHICPICTPPFLFSSKSWMDFKGMLCRVYKRL